MPSLRFLLIVLALVVVGTSIFFGSRVKKQETIYGSLSTESVKKVNAILERDEDGDGLKDWEEELWETRRDNADTDGDGAADGVEVASGRNPLKAGPDDALNQEEIDKKTTLAERGEPTLTDTIARDLFAEYLKLKQEGKPLTADDERKILLRFFNNPPPLEAVRLYTRDDLTVSEENDALSLKSYGNEVASLFRTYANKGENEINTLTAAIEREDGGILDALDERVAVYESVLRELLALAVPSAMAANHLDLVNALSAIAQSVAGMKFAVSDPAKALGSIGSYPHGFELLGNAFTEMKRILLARKISFGKDEPGIALLE